MRNISILLLCTVAWAQQPPPAAEVKPGRIEGVVVSTTGEPIARAQVRFGTQTATSDDAGKFVLENALSGRLALTAQKTGFLIAGYSLSGAGTNAQLTVGPGETIKGLTITMTPQAVVSGRVLSQDGEPVTGIRVMLLRRGYRVARASAAATNDVGEYRITNVAPGRYSLVSVREPSFDFPTGAASPTAELATYYPNSSDANGAAALELAAGQDLKGIDIRLRQGRVYSVRGKMALAGATPPQQWFVAVIPDGASEARAVLGVKTAVVRPDGSFDLRELERGSYLLISVALSGNQRGTLGSTKLNVTEDLVDYVFPLNGGSSIQGTVRLENGDLEALLSDPASAPAVDAATAAFIERAAANGATINASSRLSVGLMDASVDIGLGGTAPVGKDGTFSLPNAAPLPYRLRFGSMPQGAYVKSATFNGTDAIHNALDLTNGGGELRIVLGKGAASVSGSVKKEKDQVTGGVYVSLWSREAESGLANQGAYMTTADQNGKFTFTGLRPGTYYAAAWESIDTALTQTRDFLTILIGDALKLEIADGAAATAEVPLIPKTKIQAAEAKLP